MNQQLPTDDLTVRLQLRGREAVESALQEADPLSCSLIAASADTLNLARRLGIVLEKHITLDEPSIEQVERLSPLINQFVQLNRAGASMLHMHTRLSK